MKYLLLAIIALAMGFNTNQAIESFQSANFFAFGTHCAFIVWWILLLIDLQFGE